MPHFADKREAKIGDLVVCSPKSPGSIRTLGILVSITRGTETCNGGVLALARKWPESGWYPVANPSYPDCVTLSDCLPAESEVAAAA